MSSVWTIALHELRRFFLSPFAWITFAATQFFLAYFFYLLLQNYLQLPTTQINSGLTTFVGIGIYQIFAWLLLLIVPLTSMRVFSDELRGGTIRLLLSSPVTVTQIVIGKYLGLIIFLSLLALLVSFMPLSLISGTQLDTGLLTIGLLALILLSAALSSVGLFLSSLSRSPAMSAMSTFVVCFLLWIIHVANDSVSPELEAIISYLSLQKHFNALLSGAFSSVDLFYFILICGFFTALAIWRLDALRTQE